jgi:hypothetical protein
MSSSQFKIAVHKEAPINNQLLDPDSIAYQTEVAKACGCAFDKRILCFNEKSQNLAKQSWNRYIQSYIYLILTL